MRPERIRVLPAGEPFDGVVVDGHVTDIQYLGAECRLRVSVADGAQLLASVPSDGLAGVTVGGPVRLAWSPRAAIPVAATTINEGGDA